MMKQWKRLAALSSAIVMAAATLTYFPNDTLQNIRLEISASADETGAETTTEPQVWIEDNLTWTLDADGTLTISGAGAMKNYNSIDIDNLSPVYQNSDVKKIVVEKGVTSIGGAAFYDCSSLTVYLESGSTLTSNDLGVDESKIVSYHRWNEDNLTWMLGEDGTLIISGTGAMKEYDYSANQSPVYNNSSVKKVVIEYGVTSIGDFAFYGCPLTSITIPGSVTSIGRYAFQNCSSLKSITIPDSVTSIGDSAFYSCEKLTSITIPDSVTSIGYNAFGNCSSLKTISLSCKSSLKKSDFGERANLVSYTLHTLRACVHSKKVV